MKILFSIILCSAVHGACLPPLEGGFYDDHYSCLKQGHEKSLEILRELDIQAVNEQKYFVKFRCTEVMDDGV